MKLLTPALLAGVALTFAMPAAAQAQAYRDCEAERQNRQMAGAVIGGLLGAVVGSEVTSNSRDDRRYDRRHRYDRYDRRQHYDRYYDRRNRYDRHRNRGNTSAGGTIAGAGIGALIGAGIASGPDCYTANRATTRGYAGKPAGYTDAYGYDNGYQGNSYGYQDPYSGGSQYQEPYRDNRRYGSSGELLGGPQSAPQGRTYSASASNMTCRWQETRRMNGMDQVYMCQGSDGIWRPADTYGR